MNTATQYTKEQKIVWQNRPELKKLIDRSGSHSLVDFYRENRPPQNSLPATRKAEFLQTILGEISARFGAAIAQNACRELEQQSFVITADHHGPIVHPFFINDKLAQSAINREEGFRNLPVFAFGNVSLNNSSFPRGLILHDNNLGEVRIRFKSLKQRQSPVWTLPPYDANDLNRVRHDLLQIKKQVPSWETLRSLFEDIYANPEMLALQTFGEQITHTNFKLWKKIPGEENTNLIYLQIEDVVSALLRTHHFHKETILHRLLFDQKAHDAFEKHFEGLPGAFSKNQESGTFLFWGIHDGKRESLIRSQDGLRLAGGSFRLPMTPDALLVAIHNREIIPSAALSFIVLSFYYGLTCGGGFTQIQQLKELKGTYRNFLKEVGGTKDDETVAENVMTDCFRGEFILATLGEQEHTVPATGIDLILYRDRSTKQGLAKRLTTTTFREALEPMLPEFYKIISRKRATQTNAPPLLRSRATCPYCGSNPTPHLITRLSEFIEICSRPLEPFILNRFVADPISALGRILIHPLLTALHALRIVTYLTTSKDAGNERARVLWEEAERRGIPMRGIRIFRKTIDCYETTIRGRRIFFNGLPRPRNNTYTTPLWIDDKFILKQKLDQVGIPVSKGAMFARFKPALQFFETLEKPVIVKPRQGSRGRHTTTYIYTKEQLGDAFRIAKQLCHSVIVEEHLIGNVYRGTVIDGRLRGVLGGSPPRITGDGTHTIQERIVIKNSMKPDGVSDVSITPLLRLFLARNHYTLTTVLPQGKEIDLSEKIGVSYGGSSFEVTETTHPEIKKILESAARVVNDPILGFDFIIQDIARSPESQKWGIIECNGLPFINLHHHPLTGRPVNVAKYVWDLWGV